jgi:hypothetical protein
MNVNIGLTSYSERHPLHPNNMQDGQVGEHPHSPAGIPGGNMAAHEGRRTVEHAMEDVQAGHRAMGTHLMGMADLPTHVQHAQHAEAETVGYHMNKHKYIDPHGASRL